MSSSTDRDDYLWDPRDATPDEQIVRLEQALRPFRHVLRRDALDTALSRHRARASRARAHWVWSAVAATILVLSGVGWWRLTRPVPWSVETLAGAPASGGDRLAPGESLVTDARSSARLAVGRIGSADVGPNSRIDLVSAGASEHRLALKYGTLHAQIWAPSRFFVVEMQATRVIDLGCMYSIRTDSAGFGVIAVSYGEVELAGAGTGSSSVAFLPAGVAANLLGRRGVGLPYPVASSEAFRAAVRLAETSSSGTALTDSAFSVLLREADAQGTVTLWHLLQRTEDRVRREAIANRIASLHRLPAGITMEAIVAGDASAFMALRETLRPQWSSESQGWWRRLLVRSGLAKPVMLLRVRSAVS